MIAGAMFQGEQLPSFLFFLDDYHLSSLRSPQEHDVAAEFVGSKCEVFIHSFTRGELSRYVEVICSKYQTEGLAVKASAGGGRAGVWFINGCSLYRQ